MAVSMEQLIAFTKKLELEFDTGNFEGNAVLAVKVPTPVPGGQHDMTILVRSYDEGAFFEAMMMGFIPQELHQKSQHKLEFLFYLLHKAWETKFGTPEVNTDGEVRLLVEIPLMDAEMTLKQYGHILSVATRTAVTLQIEGVQILQNGALESSDDTPDDQRRLEEAMSAMLGMVTSSEGRAKLKVILEDDDYPDVLRDLARKLLEASSQVPDAL